MPNTLSLLQAGMPTLHAGDAVDLLDGGEVVAKGRVISTDLANTLHGQPMPLGHVSVSVVRVLKGTTYIPYPPPHEPEACRLADVMGRHGSRVSRCNFCNNYHVAGTFLQVVNDPCDRSYSPFDILAKSSTRPYLRAYDINLW